MSWASLSSRPYLHLSEHPRKTKTTLVVFECSTEHVSTNGSAAVGEDLRVLAAVSRFL